MVISRKPKYSNIDDKLVDQILSKGGSTIQPKNGLKNDNESVKITIRIPKKMLQVIDNFLNTSICSKPRNVWIKAAIEKKINTDILEKDSLL